MRLGSKAGVTLIELLIAVSLVSLLAVGILMAIRVGVNAMEKTNNRFLSNRRVLGAQRALEQQIAGLFVTRADCQVGPGAPPTRLPFFQGEPAAMRFVSSYSLQESSRGYPRILEYSVIPGEKGQGVRLVVNERLYSGPESTGALCVGAGPPGEGALFRPIEVGPNSFVLADRLAFCHFAYLEPAPPSEPQRWLPRWVRADLLPLAIRIEMAPLEPDPSNIPLVTFTAPVRVNRSPFAPYADF